MALIFSAGTALVPNDANTRAVLMSLADGSVARDSITLVRNQMGAVLTDGTVGLTGTDASKTLNFTVYDASFATVSTSTPFASALWHKFSPVASDLTGTTFYVSKMFIGAGSAAQVRVVDRDGTLGTTYTLTGTTVLRGLTVNLANTVLTYGDGATGGALLQWDLVSDTSLGTFVAGETTNQWGLDMVTLPDGSILASIQPDTAVEAYEIRRYQADGTLLETYALPAFAGTADAVRLSVDLGNLTSAFWSRSFELEQVPATFTTTTFRQWSVLGATTATLNVESPGGSSGVPPSCPFFAWGLTSSPSFATTTKPIRRVRRAPHLSTNEMLNFHQFFQLDLETGTALATGQGSNPVVTVRYSDDGGESWSDPREMSVGLRGQYAFRVYQRHLGRSRDRMYEIATSDPIAYNLVAAYLEAERGTS